MAAVPQASISLRDMSLFREQAFVGGRWESAANGQVEKGLQSRHRPADRHRAESRRGGDAARDRGCRQGAARLARAHRQGARADPAQVVRPDDGEPGRPRGADDCRAGQAAVRKPRRDRLCGLVHRVVRRGRQARLRRCHPLARPRQAHRRAEAADRRDRRDHAVEFPERDDHAQGRAGAGRGLHDGGQTRRS